MREGGEGAGEVAVTRAVDAGVVDSEDGIGVGPGVTGAVFSDAVGSGVAGATVGFGVGDGDGVGSWVGAPVGTEVVGDGVVGDGVVGDTVVGGWVAGSAQVTDKDGHGRRAVTGRPRLLASYDVACQVRSHLLDTGRCF